MLTKRTKRTLQQADDDLLYILDDQQPSSPSASQDNVIKRRRRLTNDESHSLNDAFTANARPNAPERRLLARRLGMTERAVQIWFQNRRAKQRRDDAAGSEPSLVFGRSYPNMSSSPSLTRDEIEFPPELFLDGHVLLPSPPMSAHSSTSSSTDDAAKKSSEIAEAPLDDFLQDIFASWLADDQAIMFS